MTTLEVFDEILSISQVGADKSDLIHHTKLSPTTLEKVLDFLTEHGFLKEETKSNGDKVYKTTEFGSIITKIPRVCVVIPTLNEAGSIGKVLEEAKKYADDVVVIDGNSKDETASIARKHDVTIINQNGKGKGNALRQALNYVDCDVVFMDADRSMRPIEIPRLIEAFASGTDIVKGSRFMQGGGSEDLSIIRRIGNLFFLFLVNLLCRTNYTDLCYGFFAIREEALKIIAPELKSINFEIETEICIKARKLGLKVIEVPSIEKKREKGKSNLKAFSDGFSITKTILKAFIDGFRERNIRR